MDLSSGTVRFSFGILHLTDGVSLIAVAMGLFGVSEVLIKMEQGRQADGAAAQVMKVRLRLVPAPPSVAA